MNKLQRALHDIESQIDGLRLIVLQQAGPKVKVSLKGLLKGQRFSELEIERAKKSLGPADRAK